MLGEDEMPDEPSAGGIYRDGGWSCALYPDAADQVHGDPLGDSWRQLQEAERGLPDEPDGPVCKRCESQVCESCHRCQCWHYDGPDCEADLFREGSAMRTGEPLTFAAVRNAVAGMCRICMRELPAHQYWCEAQS
jgi:hypothetical protein